MATQGSTQNEITIPPSETMINEKSSTDIPNEANNSEASNTDDEKFQKQPLTTVVLLTITSLMAMFLIALDRTIITTVRKHGHRSRRI
jgi:hypothetical protein